MSWLPLPGNERSQIGSEVLWKAHVARAVAQIKFTEWTHEGESGTIKMRAPVFEGLRFDKKVSECRFERAQKTAEATENKG